MTTTATDSRHAAARIEDAVRGRIGKALRLRGWEPRVVTYTGYGGPGWVRVLARVLMAPPRRRSESEAERRDPQRGWRAFVTTPVSGCAVRIHVGDRQYDATTDRAGYVDELVRVELAPGWHSVSLTVTGCPTAVADVRVVGTGTSVGIVSDIDDTVMVTLLPRPLLAAWNTFVLREHARRPVPGMAGLLHGLAAAHTDALVVYLSTGAWNVAPTLTRFLARHGYPPGPLLLTDWGPTRTGWFRDGVAHKKYALRRLSQEFPWMRWVLVGDDGQHDPEIYCNFAIEHRDKVLGVAIRELSAQEQLLAHGTPGAAEGADGAAAPSIVPWMTAPDGDGLLRRVAAHRLV